MVYVNKFVVAVKVNGEILRETGDAVALPFGSEYSLLLKNINSVRAMVKVSIDGTDATSNGLVIEPNSSCDLERFIGNNLERGNRFKFIERTAAIGKHRGVKADDGLVRVEYWMEKVVRQVDEVVIGRTYYNDWYPGLNPPYRSPHVPPYWGTWCQAGQENAMPTWAETMDSNAPHGTPVATCGAINLVSATRRAENKEVVNYTGITVSGSESSQRFGAASAFRKPTHSDVIVLRLHGMVGQFAVSKPVTVSAKPKCVTCGKVNKGHHRYCVECGTALNRIT